MVGLTSSDIDMLGDWAGWTQDEKDQWRQTTNRVYQGIGYILLLMFFNLFLQEFFLQ